MNKLITPTLLIAGFCIGGCTIAIPMVFAKLGIIPGIVITVAMWLLNYYPSLALAELNLRSERGLSVGVLGKNLSGRGAQIIGEIAVKLQSYAGLTMYLCGASSIIQKLLEEYCSYQASVFSIETSMAVAGIILLLFPLKTVSAVNNLLFSGLIILFIILLGVMLGFIDYTKMPWIVNPTANDMLIVCPTIFASFGYQLILHTIRDCCGKNADAFKKSIIFGSLIPTFIYIIWSIVSLSVVFSGNPEFFTQMISGKVEVGEFVRELANISSFPSFQIMVWWMSICAILTSFIGVGIGLAESMDLSLQTHIKADFPRRLAAALITVVPSYIVAALYPNAFIKVLGFAGAMIAIVGVIMPSYLLLRTGVEKSHYKELKTLPLIACFIGGFGIMIIEFFMNH